MAVSEESPLKKYYLGIFFRIILGMLVAPMLGASLFWFFTFIGPALSSAEGLSLELFNPYNYKEPFAMSLFVGVLSSFIYTPFMIFIIIPTALTLELLRVNKWVAFCAYIIIGYLGFILWDFFDDMLRQSSVEAGQLFHVVYLKGVLMALFFYFIMYFKRPPISAPSADHP